MRLSTLTIAIDPLDELLGWVYGGIYDVFIVLRNIVSVGLHGLTLHTGFKDAALPVADELRLLVYASYATVVVVGGVIVMSHETVQSRYSVKEILPRMALALGLVWVGELLLRGVSDLDTKIVDALLEWNEKNQHWAFGDGTSDGFGAMLQILAIEQTGNYELVAVLQVVVMLVAVMVLAWCAIIRMFAWFGVVMTAPIALACHGLPVTEAAARLWWRMLGACLGSSIGQAACVWVWGRLAFDTDGTAIGENDRHVQNDLTMDFLYVVVLVWAMWKVHAAAFAWARGRSVSFPGARLAKGLAIAAAAGWVRRRGRHKPHKTSDPATNSESASKFRMSTGWKNADGTTRSIRVQRPKINPKGIQRAKAKAGTAAHTAKDSPDIGVEPWDLKHWPAGAEYPRRDPKRPITPLITDGADSRVRVKRGLSTTNGVVRRMGTASPADAARKPGRDRVSSATPNLPAHSTRKPDSPDADALDKASQRLRRDQINRNVARQAATSKHLQNRTTPPPKPSRKPGERS